MPYLLLEAANRRGRLGAAPGIRGLPVCDHPRVRGHALSGRAGRRRTPRRGPGLTASSGRPFAFQLGQAVACVCNLYEYAGIHPLSPELWLLPPWLPFHPSRWYCHTRLIYLGMCYLWGNRFAGSRTRCAFIPRGSYGAPYASLDFPGARNRLAHRDCLVAPSGALKAAYAVLNIVEACVPAALRRRALASVLARIEYEQGSTQYAALSPVNGVLNILALHAADPNHADLAPSFAGVERWLWMDAEGARCCGARSQTWDTSFVVEAACAAGPDDSFMSGLARAASFLKANQASAELPDGRRFFRSGRSGGWCFSDAYHGWPVSDTTAEAVARS